MVVNDLCTCSFDVDNVVVDLFIRIIAGKFDILTRTNPRKLKYFLFVYANFFVYYQLGQSP